MNTNARDEQWMQLAVDLSRRCSPTSSAYNVGCVIANRETNVISCAYSREGGSDNRDHAEEAAIMKLVRAGRKEELRGTTLYATLEPCHPRASGRTSCTQLIIDFGIARVIFAAREPHHFVACQGAETLQKCGVEVCEMTEFAGEVAVINSHVAFRREPLHERLAKQG